LFCDLKREHNLDAVIAWIEEQVLFAAKLVGPALAAGPSRNERDNRDGMPTSGSPIRKR
jgi:hypothetical protein